MNETAQRVRTDHAEHPQNQQKGSNREKHSEHPSRTASHSRSLRLLRNGKCVYPVKHLIVTATHFTETTSDGQVKMPGPWGLKDLHNTVADGIASQVGDRMQAEFSHEIGAMGFRRLYA